MGRYGCEVIPGCPRKMKRHDQEPPLNPKSEKDEELKEENDPLTLSDFEMMGHRNDFNLDHAWAHTHPHTSSKVALDSCTTETLKECEVLPAFYTGARRVSKAKRDRIAKLTTSMTVNGPSAILFLTKTSNYILVSTFLL
ncbi:hypothetical protein O6H91_01G064600 [Diphasiastrum complanatum]|uniref:Uncharacterized protein n=1 Tax=Diphasiastrum complanatum TaxID=34168 RepID=A0ACC2ERX4_DIPCM|nr:hypothetical protein O6H91_01G064600 [Diphasiastrum complanatum]